MAIKTIQLEADGGQPQVSVFIGQAQFGDYRVAFKSRSTGTKVVEGEGDNADDIADHFDFKTPLADMNGGVLTWTINVVPFSEQEELYFVRLDVRQGGSPVESGVFEYTGPLTGAKSILGAAKVAVS